MRIVTTYANATDTALAAAFTEITETSSTDAHILTEAHNTAVLRITTDDIRQHIDGFGASITQASSFLWRNSMRNPEQVIQDLFSVTHGIGLSMLRQPIGPSDHVTQPYRFVRRIPDKHLYSLDFSAEQREILPMVLAAQHMRNQSSAHAAAVHVPPINIIASPWSAPRWMKTNFSTLGKRKWSQITGWLRPRMYATYAEYIARFIDLYASYGLHVFGVTPTNEPDYPQSRWPSMAMTPYQQARFVSRFLAPCLKAHGLDNVRIMGWDHNYSTDHYPEGRFVRELYAYPRAFAALAGSAWHYYGGSARTMSDIHNTWPTKGIWVTEASGGEWGPRNWDNALISMGNQVIDMLNNWAQSVVLWNIALDTHGGPDYYYLRNDRQHSTNRGLLTVDPITGEVQKNADYYVIGHFSRFIPIGSYCIGSTLTPTSGIHATACSTPDQHIVVVATNELHTPVTLQIQLEQSTASGAPLHDNNPDAYESQGLVQLPPRSLNTVLL